MSLRVATIEIWPEIIARRRARIELLALGAKDFAVRTGVVVTDDWCEALSTRLIDTLDDSDSEHVVREAVARFMEGVR